MPRNGDTASGCGAAGASGGDCGDFDRKVSKGLQRDIMSDGVTFDVRYIGCLEIKSSMKTLEFETRSHVAK